MEEIKSLIFLFWRGYAFLASIILLVVIGMNVNDVRSNYSTWNSMGAPAYVYEHQIEFWDSNGSIKAGTCWAWTDGRGITVNRPLHEKYEQKCNRQDYNFVYNNFQKNLQYYDTGWNWGNWFLAILYVTFTFGSLIFICIISGVVSEAVAPIAMTMTLLFSLAVATFLSYGDYRKDTDTSYLYTIPSSQGNIHGKITPWVVDRSNGKVYSWGRGGLWADGVLEDVTRNPHHPDPLESYKRLSNR